jgi:hypothetical protein
VHHGAQGDLAQRERVAHFGCHAGAAAQQGLAHLQAVRREDVTLLAIGVSEQGDACAAVRIVLDRLHRSGNAVLVALEVDVAVALLVTTADVAHGHLALVVAATALGAASGQGFLRHVGGDALEVGDHAVARACGDGVELADAHGLDADAAVEVDGIAGLSR